jgi:hypothetical protein
MSATTTSTGALIASCSFCSKPNSEVRKLVAGPGVFICNECVDLSVTIIAATVDESPEESARRRAEFVGRSTEDTLMFLSSLARSSTQLENDMIRWIRSLREQDVDSDRIASVLGTSVDSSANALSLGLVIRSETPADEGWRRESR